MISRKASDTPRTYIGWSLSKTHAIDEASLSPASLDLYVKTIKLLPRYISFRAPFVLSLDTGDFKKAFKVRLERNTHSAIYRRPSERESSVCCRWRGKPTFKNRENKYENKYISY